MNDQKIKNSLINRIPFDTDAKSIDLKKSHGSFIVDADGNEYLDMMSSFGSMSIGYSHPTLLNKMMNYPEVFANKISNSDLYSEIYATFIEKFFQKSQDFQYGYFCDGGSVGVSNSLKAAFDWKSQSLGLREDETDNLNVVHLQKAFHGRTGYTLSLTNTTPDKIARFPKFKWTRIINPECKFPINLDEVKKLEFQSLSEAEYALKKGNVASIIVEIINAEGGEIHHRKEYFQELRKLADKYEAMLIFDEVQTGGFVSGTTWLYEQINVIPDLICFGKRWQVCGFASTKRIDSIKNNVFKAKSRINSTWNGNIVDYLRSSIILDIIKEENIVENVRQKGDYLLSELQNIGNKNSEISNIRGVGLLIAFDLNSTNDRNKLLQKLNEKIFILPAGEKSIRLRPFLNISKKECDLFLNILEDSLSS